MLVLWDVCRAQRQQQVALYTYYNKIHNRPSVLKKKKKKRENLSWRAQQNCCHTEYSLLCMEDGMHSVLL